MFSSHLNRSACLLVAATSLAMANAALPGETEDQRTEARWTSGAAGRPVVLPPGTVAAFTADRSVARSAVRSTAPLARERANPVPAGIDGDWNNFGGNPGRNGQTTVLGPTADNLLWDNTDDVSIISWHPVTLDDRVFAIRESNFPQIGAANDKLVAYDLNTGDEAWSVVVPYAGDPEEEWIAYIAGARDGKVYAARGGSGRTTPVYAFDVANGDQMWASTYETVAGPQDGVVFAPNGDLIVGDFDNVVRIDATDGSTVWQTPRSCPVSGNCGAAASETGAYIDQPVFDGNIITKLDLATGDILYSSTDMAGFTTQNAPFVSPDGQTVYFARSQNNPPFDNLFAFEDTGVALVELWNRPVRWTTSHEHAIGPDGSIYTFTAATEFVRLDPATGEILNNAGVLSPTTGNLSPRSAVDSTGTVYVSNGWANVPDTDGRVWAFTADLSTNLFTLVLDRPNSGGPSLGKDGTLVVSDRLGVYAYRADPQPLIPTVSTWGLVLTAGMAVLIAGRMLRNRRRRRPADS